MRKRTNGREKWKSLKTKSSGTAKLRLAEFEKAGRKKAHVATLH